MNRLDNPEKEEDGWEGEGGRGVSFSFFVYENQLWRELQSNELKHNPFNSSSVAELMPSTYVLTAENSND